LLLLPQIPIDRRRRAPKIFEAHKGRGGAGELEIYAHKKIEAAQ